MTPNKKNIILIIKSKTITVNYKKKTDNNEEINEKNNTEKNNEINENTDKNSTIQTEINQADEAMHEDE